MKKNVLKITVFSLILLGIVSCVGTSKENKLADEQINELERYVDSIKMVSAEERQEKWDEISTDYEAKIAMVNEALLRLNEKDRRASQKKIDASNAEYEEIKVHTSTMPKTEEKTNSTDKSTGSNSSKLLRDRLFGAGKIGSDMNFNWVNKDNILAVYQNFFESYKQHKGDFSREDYDEAKLMYEALDSRKNTVEKEGLSSEDNEKIASIKFKLAPMFKINRIGAKSRENKESKE